MITISHLIILLIGLVAGGLIGIALTVEYLNRRTANYVVIPSTLPKATARDFKRRERANKRALARSLRTMRGVQ